MLRKIIKQLNINIMNSKEKILEEFNEFTKTLEADFITEGYSAYGDLEDFISQTIDRVREETIKEVEEMLSKIVLKDLSGKWSEEVVDFSTSIVDATVLKIKQSLKSLINK